MRALPLALPFVLLFVAFSGCAGDADPEADALADAVATLDTEATATTGVIRGVVVDQTVTPLASAVVTLTSSGQNTTTSEAGAFAFEGLEAGTYFMTATLADYVTAQQSAEVVAGVSDPEAVKILLQAIERGEPLVVGFQATIFVESSIILLGTGYTLGGVASEHGYWFRLDIEENATVVQSEASWDAVTPLAESARIGGGTYAGDDGLHTDGQNGPSPLVFRANGTEGDDTADNVYYEIFAGDSMGLPGGMVANQQYDFFIHAFYNFMPNQDWLFSRDGEHPLP